MKKMKKYIVGGILILLSVSIFLYIDRLSKVNATEQAKKIEQKNKASDVVEQQPDTSAKSYDDTNVPRLPIKGIFSIPDGAQSSIRNNQVIITDAKLEQVGSIFSTNENKMDLTKEFTSEMYIKIDGEADGIAFVMHDDKQRTEKYSGTSGAGLGVYAGKSINARLNGQIQRSFAVEFDTYYNGDSNDSDEIIDKNNDYGHVAYTFPDNESMYDFKNSEVGFIVSRQQHYGLQMSSFPLGNNVWKKFIINWQPFNQGGGQDGYLTYQFDNMSPVTATIPRSTFNTDSVYWGFTGSTGGLMESAMVTFASVPGLVYYTDTLTAHDSKEQLLDDTVASNNGHEIQVEYSGIYAGGKQDLLNPTLILDLTPGQRYQEGSFIVNGEAATPIQNGNSLEINLPDRTLEDEKINVSFKIKNEGFKTGDKPVISSTMVADNFKQTDSSNTKVSYVIDAEAPTAIGNLTVINKDDADVIANSPDFKQFLRSIEDNYSAAEDITATLRPNQGIQELVKERGPKNFEVEIEDLLGNVRIIKVPIFVKDKDEKIGNNTNSLLSARDFQIKTNEYPKTTNELSNMIVDNSSLELWEFADDGSYTQLNTDLVEIDQSNLPPVGKFPPVNVYLIPISYGSDSSQIKTTIELDIKQGISSVVVDFVDEAEKKIHDSITLNGIITEKLNLKEIDSIKAALKAVEEDHYELVAAPDNETEILIEEAPKTVQYKFKGTLYIESFPSTLNFGDKHLNKELIQDEQAKYDVPLIIKDNRKDKSPWKLTATLEQPLQSEEVKSEELLRALQYKISDKNIVTLRPGEALPIETGSELSSGEYNVSKNWDEKKSGVRLNIFRNEIVQLGKYKASILWQVGETP